MTHHSSASAGRRFQLERMISGLSTGVITLETDGSLRYVNWAALQMHNVTDIEALGSSSTAYRERFRLMDLTGIPLPGSAYPLERLLNGDTFSDLNVRVPVEGDELVHKCRGICVEDEAGETDFYALFIEDDTEQHDAERRFERTFAANPAPALINRLSDLRFIKVNEGFLTMTGFKREEIIGRTAYEFDVLAGIKAKELALRKFHEGQTIPPLESYLNTQSGGKKFVVVGGQPLEVNNEPCMLLTFIDLDERKKGEDALRQSEERFSKAFSLSPIAGVISAVSDGRIFNLNSAFVELTGYAPGEAVGRSLAELGLWRSDGEKLVASLLKTQRGYRNLELKLHTKTGEVCDVMVSAETLNINDEACVLSMFHDVSDTKRTEAELIEAVNMVMKDPEWFSNSVVKKLMAVRGKKPNPQTEAKLGRLTSRELQVFEAICRGQSTTDISAKLGVAGNTVRNYFSSLYKKLEVHSRAEVIVWAKRHNVTP